MYLDSFETEHVPQEILSKIKGKSISHNIFRIYNDDSILCRYLLTTLKKIKR